MLKRSLQVSAVVRLFLALWLAITPAFVWACSMTLCGAGGGTATTTPFGITFISTAQNTSAAGTFTFTSQNIGTADPTRIVVVAIADGVNAVTVSSVTIGGNAAAQATGAATSPGANTDIWYLAVPSGTTANIVVTFSGAQGRIAIDVYSVVGTGAAFSTASNGVGASGITQAATATVPAGGGAIAILNVHSASAAGTVTNGGNLTIDQNGVAFGGSTIGSGSNTTASGSTAFTFNWTTSTDHSVSVATFSP